MDTFTGSEQIFFAYFHVIITSRGDYNNMENNRSIKELLTIVASIEGWLTDSEQYALLHLPSQVDYLQGDIVEIGSYRGKSTIALGLGSTLMSTKKDQFMP